MFNKSWKRSPKVHKHQDPAVRGECTAASVASSSSICIKLSGVLFSETLGALRNEGKLWCLWCREIPGSKSSCPGEAVAAGAPLGESTSARTGDGQLLSCDKLRGRCGCTKRVLARGVAPTVFGENSENGSTANGFGGLAGPFSFTEAGQYNRCFNVG